MTTDFRIYLLIGLFIYLCIIVIFFNSVIRRRSKSKNVLSNKEIENWDYILPDQMFVEQKGKRHKRYLIKKLAHSKALIFYSISLSKFKEKTWLIYDEYLAKNHLAFERLADIYLKKNEFKKACYVSFVSDFPEITKYSPQVLSTLTYYLKDADEKNNLLPMTALRMFSNCGSIKAFINVVQMINDNKVFIHEHALTTEIYYFNGDKEQLLKQLQKHKYKWSESIANSIDAIMWSDENK